MPSAPQFLYSAAQLRELERIAIAERGIAADTLMERAGRAAFYALVCRWPRARRIAVLCGPGNNGGDGYVVARLAHVAGLDVQVLALGESRSTAARAVRVAAERAGVTLGGFDHDAVHTADVVVDALLGIGLERPLEGAWKDAIDTINRAGRPVLALDIPSGLHADTGAVLGCAVRASACVTFIGYKAGLFTGDGREYCGAIELDDLDLAADVYARVPALAGRIAGAGLRGYLPRRVRHAHKGDAGHVLVVGGNHGMAGAARLAGEAAYRSGAGLVSLATRDAHATHIAAACAELMAHGIETDHALRALFPRITVIAAGPGLGRDEWAQGVWSACLDAGRPLVVDADALQLLAADPGHRDDWVLTPHAGEAARLLGTDTRAIQHDRYAAAREIVARYGGVCVLKGAGTLVAAGAELRLCDRGNPGMAVGGMGDVLTGAIAALRAQGLAPFAAAELGVWLHACAGDAAAAGGEIGLLAGDLLPRLRPALNEIVA